MQNRRTQWAISFNLVLLFVAAATVLLQAGVVQMQQRQPNVIGNVNAYQQGSRESATSSDASAPRGDTRAENETLSSGRGNAWAENETLSLGHGNARAENEMLSSGRVNARAENGAPSLSHGNARAENGASASDPGGAQAEHETQTSGSSDAQIEHGTLAAGRSDTREIVCWGDSLTSGMGASKAVIVNGFESFDASGKSYPEILEHFTGITTYNFGVAGARSDEIAFMQGAIDKLPEPELQLESTGDEAVMADGETTSPSADVANDLTDENESTVPATDATAGEETNANAEPSQKPDSQQPAEAAQSTDDVQTPDAQASNTSSADSPRSVIDEQIIEEGKKHPGDVLLLEIGSNGGWNNDYAQLIDQYRKMIEHSGCKDYLIIGDTDDPGTSLGDLNQKPFKSGTGPGETKWEQALSNEFGDRFINMRTYLIRNGLADAGLVPTEDDKKLASAGCISPQLRADWTHLNSFGYYAKAKAVYLRGSELGYWNPPRQTP